MKCELIKWKLYQEIYHELFYVRKAPVIFLFNGLLNCLVMEMNIDAETQKDERILGYKSAFQTLFIEIRKSKINRMI